MSMSIIYKLFVTLSLCELLTQASLDRIYSPVSL